MSLKTSFLRVNGGFCRSRLPNKTRDLPVGTCVFEQIVGTKAQWGFLEFVGSATPHVSYTTQVVSAKDFSPGGDTVVHWGGEEVVNTYAPPSGLDVDIYYGGSDSWAFGQIFGGLSVDIVSAYYQTSLWTRSSNTVMYDRMDNGFCTSHITVTRSVPRDPLHSVMHDAVFGVNWTPFGSDLDAAGQHIPVWLDEAWPTDSSGQGSYPTDSSGVIVSPSSYFQGLYGSLGSCDGSVLMNTVQGGIDYDAIPGNPINPLTGTTFVTGSSGWKLEPAGEYSAAWYLSRMRFAASDYPCFYWFGEIQLARPTFSPAVRVVGHGYSQVGEWIEIPQPATNPTPTGLWPIISNRVYLFVGYTPEHFAAANPTWTVFYG